MKASDTHYRARYFYNLSDIEMFYFSERKTNCHKVSEVFAIFIKSQRGISPFHEELREFHRYSQLLEIPSQFNDML